MKPTFLLVHAAFADPSSWNKVILPLRAQGFDAYAVSIPLTSVSDDAAAVRRFLERIEGPVVLAAHSYAGAVITAAAVDQSKVKALVYIAAMAPAPGETVAALLHLTVDPHMVALAPDAHGFIWMPLKGFTHAVAPESAPDEIALMAVTQKPISVNAIAEPAAEAAWAAIPSWYLLAEHDRVIVASTQRMMAERAKATIVARPVDHTPLTSAPHHVVDILLEAARATV